MHTLINKRFFLIFATLTAVLFLGACTLEDGQPFGYASVELAIEEPGLGPDFALESFEVEVESLHIWAGASAEAQPDDEHEHDHDHDHGAEEEEHAGEAEALEVAHLEIDQLIASSDPISLGEVGITSESAVERIEVEIHALSVHGVLTRDGQSFPTTITLPHAHLTVSGSVDLSFTVDKPETQHLHLHLHWPENWLEDVDIDALEVDADGGIDMGEAANHDTIIAIGEHLHGARLVTEVR